MKFNLGFISLILWILTIGTFAVFFVKGNTSQSSDNRRAIHLTEQEKNLVLDEMRTMLKAVNGVIGAMSENDMPKASAAASTAGMSMAVDVNPMLMAKLPLDFKELGMGTHKAFDDLATEINKGKSTTEILKSLTAITSRCIACHEANKITFDGAQLFNGVSPAQQEENGYWITSENKMALAQLFATTR